jgi:hypothetical protein
MMSGAERTYSHWRGAPALPDALRADTSTGILLKAGQEPQRWLAGLEWACNDHVDADGLLAVALACQPGLGRAQQALLIGAAEAGDFTAYPGAAAYRLLLRLNQYIRSCCARSADWQAAAYRDIPAALPELIRTSGEADDERDAQVRLVEETQARLRTGDGFLVERAERLLSIGWRRRLGQGSDAFNVVHQREDLPLHAIAAIARADEFQLLAMATPSGTVYQLDAPRHSWAETVELPHVPWPDLSDLRDRLNAEETGPVRWLARPEASQAGFVCLLASTSPAGQPEASCIPPERLRSACAEALAKRP